MRNKAREFAVLLIVFVSVFFVICMSGCTLGCNELKVTDKNIDNGKIQGVSVPGCGCVACQDCDSCLWPTSLKCVTLNGTLPDSNKKNMSFTACDSVYYGSKSSGCGHIQKSCYTVCVEADVEVDGKNGKVSGCVYGQNDNSLDYSQYAGKHINEYFIGCYDGNLGCDTLESDSQFGMILKGTEIMLDID